MDTVTRNGRPLFQYMSAVCSWCRVLTSSSLQNFTFVPYSSQLNLISVCPSSVFHPLFTSLSLLPSLLSALLLTRSSFLTLASRSHRLLSSGYRSLLLLFSLGTFHLSSLSLNSSPLILLLWSIILPSSFVSSYP